MKETVAILLPGVCLTHSGCLLFCIILPPIFFLSAESIFKIRKCCHRDEFLDEYSGNCVNISTYPEVLVTSSDDPWAWWFPNVTHVLSKENKTLIDFPSDRKLDAGLGQPCPPSLTAALPSFYYNFSFMDDGSVLVFSNVNQRRDVTYEPLSFCVDRMASMDADNYTTIDFMLSLCPCGTVNCVLKCCQPGMFFRIPAGEEHITDDNCEQYDRSSHTDWSPSNDGQHFVLYHFPRCPAGHHIYIPNVATPAYHEIFDNGTAIIDGVETDELQFCGEQIVHDGLKTHADFLLRCYPQPSEFDKYMKVRRVLYGSLSAVGAFFLIATLIVYALLRKEKTVNDKNLISQTWSLLIGYVGITISQLALYYLPHWLCVLIGYIILYFFLASFFWLNVLCIDLAWAFSELRLIRDIMIWQNRRRFLQYSLYSWLSPAIIVLTAIIVDFSPGVPDYIIKPEIKTSCWFKNASQAKLAYFYGPIAVLLAINIILFIYTAYKILAAQTSSALLQASKAHEKQRFILYVKLFCLMGLSWILELVSWMVGGPDYYWYGTDLINLFRAIFIFITLCCKRQVVDDLKQRFRPQTSGRRRTASPSVVTLSSQNPEMERRLSQITNL